MTAKIRTQQLTKQYGSATVLVLAAALCMVSLLLFARRDVSTG
jgi:hypothetical protein